MCALIAGFVLGILASVIAAIVYDQATRPLLAVFIGEGSRSPPVGLTSHRFIHLMVRNVAANWPFTGRRPAWSCQATLSIVTDDGLAATTGPLVGRWTSLPEPLLVVTLKDIVVPIPDVAQMLTGRRIDVHNHEDQTLAVAVKFDGAADCHLFNNESYQFDRWSNPAWRVGPGRHHLRVVLAYDRGSTRHDFWLHNDGSRRDDVRLEPHA